VDDDPLIAASTVALLEDLGHRVIEAHSAKEALAAFRNGVSPVAMPGMTGIDLAVALRKQNPRLPILLATGYAKLKGASPIELPRLGKSYTQEQLSTEIARLLPRTSDRIALDHWASLTHQAPAPGVETTAQRAGAVPASTPPILCSQGTVRSYGLWMIYPEQNCPKGGSSSESWTSGRELEAVASGVCSVPKLRFANEGSADLTRHDPGRNRGL
jgi:CheY-like chemotaxis protein